MDDKIEGALLNWYDAKNGCWGDYIFKIWKSIEQRKTPPSEKPPSIASTFGSLCPDKLAENQIQLSTELLFDGKSKCEQYQEGSTGFAIRTSPVERVRDIKHLQTSAAGAVRNAQ